MFAFKRRASPPIKGYKNRISLSSEKSFMISGRQNRLRPQFYPFPPLLMPLKCILHPAGRGSPGGLLQGRGCLFPCLGGMLQRQICSGNFAGTNPNGLKEGKSLLLIPPLSLSFCPISPHHFPIPPTPCFSPDP